MRQPYLGATGGRAITAALCKPIYHSSDDSGLCGGMVLGNQLASLHNVLGQGLSHWLVTGSNDMISGRGSALFLVHNKC